MVKIMALMTIQVILQTMRIIRMMLVIILMQSSVSSCSAANSPSSPVYECHGMDYDDYVQQMIGTNPYAPGYAPLAPASSPVADSFHFVQDGLDVQASYGFYPFEVLTGSDPLEFIVYYPYPWNPGSPEYWDEWSMVNTTSHFLDHFTWFEGEWHLV
ncbi:uncharacterized protein LOC116001498 [Ipomoea triloba]|uniref:uncharacterized protein LOC116001498 n=1 Tax=Ipomoea triloba TaxID=35885 RepID=UPI00125E53C9|nr:uncharacterized protein LOC116001498 [Ipomoea triloba]